MWIKSPLSYAVRDFYLNGGAQAVILRLYKAPAGESGIAHIVNPLPLQAAGPGLWGNKLKVKIDYDGITSEIADRYGLNQNELFNLTVQDTSPNGSIEKIRNLSVVESQRRLDRVLAEQSLLIRAVNPLPSAIPSVGDFISFTNGADSQPLEAVDYIGREDNKTGIYALEKTDLFNLLSIPPDMRDGNTDATVYQAAMEYCYRRRAILLVDSPSNWSSNKDTATATAITGLSDLGLSGESARNAALYFPRVIESDPLREGQLDTFVPSGLIAGIIARTDAARGVWKAPAGLDASINGIQGLEVNLTDAENGQLNPLGINCLRSFPVTGKVVWGTRTLRGADQLADEYKYLPVRRLLLYLEESLYRGTQWVVFEPNDEPLWAQIRLNVGAFLNNLFRQGAFQGKSPKEAYFVKCDSQTTTQNDINLGIVNIIVGFAPLKPAEFVILKFQQIAGEIAA